MQITHHNKSAQDSHITNEETLCDIDIDVMDDFLYEFSTMGNEVLIHFKDKNEQMISIKMKKNDLQEIFDHYFDKPMEKILLCNKKRRILI